MTSENQPSTPEKSPERQALVRYLGHVACGAAGGVAGGLILHATGIDMNPAIDAAVVGGGVAVGMMNSARSPRN